MDRRTIVYYNSRTRRVTQANRHHKSRVFKKVLLAGIFVASIVGLKVFFGSPQVEQQANVLAQTSEKITEPVVPKEIREHPLQNVALPTDGQTAIGTTALGVIKRTDNEHQAPIASITKVITALVLLDKHPLSAGEKGDTITLNENDLAYFNEYYSKLGTVTAVTVGGSMSYYESLQAMLLPSSNNMSDTLVDSFFDNREAYLSYANDYLKKNGLDDTFVADASGFSPESKSTPSDLIKLGQLALRHPVIAEIVAQKSASLAVAGDVPNYNQLISEPDVIGIKPGATDEAGYCLLFAARVPTQGAREETVLVATIGHVDRPSYVVLLHKLLQDSRDAFLHTEN